MRISTVLGSIAAFTAVVTAVPHLVSYEDTCVPSISTVHATPSAIYLTVTVHDAPKSTVYITVPAVSYTSASELPITTLTQFSTTTIFRTSLAVGAQTSVGGQMALYGTQSYETTVVETVRITVTVPYSGVTITGPLSYYVLNGTTSWLGGKTPSPDSTYVYESATVTVVPVISGAHLTTTLRSTIHLMSEITIIKTLSNGSSRVSSGIGNAFTAYPVGGWNVSTVAAGYTALGRVTAGTGTAPTTKPTLVTEEPTFDFYPTTARLPFSISSYAAQSGFKGYSTLTAPAITSPPSGGSTTALVNGQIYSWVISTPSTVLSPATPPYANSTSLISKLSDSTKASTYPSGFSSGLINSTRIPTSISAAAPAGSAKETSASAGYADSTSSINCGTAGDFLLNFDDIPPLAIGNQSIDDVAPFPVFNPYRQFDFSNGFVVVPPPRVPYLPSSKPLLLEFIPNFTVNRTNDESGPNAREFGWSGDIGNGDHGRTGCFSFNMYGASFGCDSRRSACVFTFLGFRYDRLTGATKQVTSQSIAVPACPKLNNCPLTPVTIDSSFQFLDAVRINVTVGGLPKLWWVDDVRLGWYNNTCSAGLCRQTTKIH